MKRIASIGIILVMSLQCFYKLGLITYFQLNRDYIAEVFCINKEKPITMCYGQCFLAENLNLANDKESDDNTAPIGNQRVDLPIFVITEDNILFQASNEVEESNSPYLLNSSSAHHSVPFHPPA